MALLPFLIPDVEVSRAMRRHMLAIPGESSDFVYTTLAHALDSMLAHGFDEFVLHIGGTDYHCKPAPAGFVEHLRRELLEAIPSPEPLEHHCTKERKR